MEKYLGENVPKLGFGLMRLPTLADGIDIEQVKTMVDMFLEAGFCYFDTAFSYANGESEKAIRKALVERYPREKYLLATKLPAWMGKNKEEAEQMFYTSLERTGAGYFDYYLLHNLGESRTEAFATYGIWDFLAQKKKEGYIKHLGFSFHDKAEVLEEVLRAHPEMDFVQLQINYADWEYPTIESRKCHEVARAHGKPIIIMEPVKGGNLANPPQSVKDVFAAVNPDASPASWAIRFAASMEGVITVLSGMSNIEQMQDNISYMKDFKPLTEEEQAAVVKARDLLNAIPIVPCTACEYCMKGCPASIAIPGIFKSLNIHMMYDNLPSAKSAYTWNTDGHKLNKASACIECGQCEEVCPQHIHIRDELKKAAELLEN